MGRSRIGPPPPGPVEQNKPEDEPKPRRWGGYRFWAELLARTSAVDVLLLSDLRRPHEALGDGDRPQERRALPGASQERPEETHKDWFAPPPAELLVDSAA
jgi:hypothetical protein